MGFIMRLQDHDIYFLLLNCVNVFVVMLKIVY